MAKTMIITVFDLTKYVINITQSTCWGAIILSRFQMGDKCLVTSVEHSRTNTRPTYLQTTIEECTQQLWTSCVALDLDTQHMWHALFSSSCWPLEKSSWISHPKYLWNIVRPNYVLNQHMCVYNNEHFHGAPMFCHNQENMGLSENRVCSQWNSHLKTGKWSAKPLGTMGYTIFRHTHILNSYNLDKSMLSPCLLWVIRDPLVTTWINMAHFLWTWQVFWMISAQSHPVMGPIAAGTMFFLGPLRWSSMKSELLKLQE